MEWKEALDSMPADLSDEALLAAGWLLAASARPGVKSQGSSSRAKGRDRELRGSW